MWFSQDLLYLYEGLLRGSSYFVGSMKDTVTKNPKEVSRETDRVVTRPGECKGRDLGSWNEGIRTRAVWKGGADRRGLETKLGAVTLRISSFESGTMGRRCTDQ